MKLVFFFLSIMIVHTGICQVSNQDRMTYQEVVYDGNNRLVLNKEVGLKLSILKGSSSGTVVYVESHQVTSNANGLITLEVGGGNTISGSYDTINWTDNSFYLKTEIDPDGGTNYSLTTTTSMLSVPYALHAKSVEIERDPTFMHAVASKITADDTLRWSSKLDNLVAGESIEISGDTIHAVGNGGAIVNPFYIGQDTLGGIVFYLYYDSLNQIHGLILSKVQTWLFTKWQNTPTLVNANKIWNGKYNTSLMSDSPAKDYIDGLNSNNEGGFNDWYLPAMEEAKKLLTNLFLVNRKLFELNETLINTNSRYITSTEVNNDKFFSYSPSLGMWLYLEDKNFIKLISRAIRSF